ncbi:MAG: NUDIX domain-containing protein [Planctomycetota bacterium]|jgi:mutator protein MutT
MKLEAVYRYCPACGTQRASFEPYRPYRCHACGHTTFFGPVAAVGAIVTDEDGKVLLVRRANDPAKGKLGMPGGFIDPDESSEEALRREMLEEVGLPILSMQYLTSAPNQYLYRGIELPVLDMFYIVEVEHRDVRTLDGEISDWIWTDLSEEILDQMAFVSNRYALTLYRGRMNAKGT